MGYDDEEAVELAFSKAEALVIFDWLARHDDPERGLTGLGTEDPAEVHVLSGLLAHLERRLSEPFRFDYAEVLAEARAEVRRPLEG